MAAPLLRRGAATTSASKNRLLPGLRGLLIPPDRGRSPLFRVCPAGSWEQLWFLVVHILDSHLRRYYCTTSTCDGLVGLAGLGVVCLSPQNIVLVSVQGR